MTAQAGVLREGATRWFLPAIQFLSTIYVQGVVWLGVWVLIPAVFLGFHAIAVDSGSMAPAVRMGDVIMIAPYEGEALEPGRIVTFGDIARDGRLVTHRIVARNDDGTYQTKGDANQAPDSTPLEPSRISGVARLVVPLIGRPLVWASTGQWLFFSLWGALTLFATVMAVPGRTKRPKKDRGEREARRPLPVGPRLPAPRPLLAPQPLVAPATSPLAMLRPPARFVLPMPPPRFALVPPPPPVVSLAIPPPPVRVPGLPPAPPPPRDLVLPAPARPAPMVKVPLPPLTPPRREPWSAARGPRAWVTPLHAVVIALILAIIPVGFSGANMAAATSNVGNGVASSTLLPPTSPSASAGTLLCRITVSWTPTTSTWADGYKLYRSTSSEGPFGERATITPYTTSSHVDSGLSTNTTYYYQLRSYKGTWLSAATSTVSAKTTLTCA